MSLNFKGNTAKNLIPEVPKRYGVEIENFNY